MNWRISRKSFLKTVGFAGPALALFPFLATAALTPEVTAGKIRIQPLSGKKYSPSFLRLSARARFNSIEDALRRVKNRRVGFAVCSEKPDFGRELDCSEASRRRPGLTPA